MHSVINKRIDLTRTSQYRLSIQASLNGFSFAILDEAAALCRQLYHYTFSTAQEHEDVYSEMVTLCQKYPQLKYLYSSTQCVYCAPSFTLVPEPLFVPDKAASILQSIHAINDLDEVYFHALRPLGAVCVYAIPNSITAPLIKKQPATRFCSIAVSLIEMAASLLGHTRILLFYQNQHLYLTLMKEQQLLLCNAFHAPEFNTALYYLFFVLHQWQLNPETLRLYISGQISRPHRRLLHNYFPMLSILSSETILLPSLEHALQYNTILHPVCAS